MSTLTASAIVLGLLLLVILAGLCLLVWAVFSLVRSVPEPIPTLHDRIEGED